jgi:hypothetical protein
MHASLPALLAATDEYTPMSLREVLLFFVALPAAMYCVIWMLVSFPHWRRSASHRPGDPWTADPQWFGALDAPGQPERQALEAGGAAPRQDAAAASPEGGGTSARW